MDQEGVIMTSGLRILLLTTSVLAAVWMFRRIRKCRVKQEDATFWVCFAFALAILGIFPELSYFMSDKLGFMAPVNFIFLVIIFLLIEKLLSVSIQVSLLESKVEVMAAELAIRNKDIEEKSKGIKEHGTEQES